MAISLGIYPIFRHTHLSQNWGQFDRADVFLRFLSLFRHFFCMFQFVTYSNSATCMRNGQGSRLNTRKLGPVGPTLSAPKGMNQYISIAHAEIPGLN